VSESRVESYLRKEVKKAGGACRKFVSPGRRHVPDNIALWSVAIAEFVECKDKGRGARAGQKREHARLKKLGFRVFLIDTKEKVDQYIRGELPCL